MERKSKVTQSAVNAACEQLQADNKNVTVNAVISITHWSFSTAQPHFNAEELNELLIAVPPEQEQIEMSSYNGGLSTNGTETRLRVFLVLNCQIPVECRA